MPRALFAVLSVGVYHAGAAGTGALYSATAAGGDGRGDDDRMASRTPAGLGAW